MYINNNMYNNNFYNNVNNAYRINSLNNVADANNGKKETLNTYKTDKDKDKEKDKKEKKKPSFADTLKECEHKIDTLK